MYKINMQTTPYNNNDNRLKLVILIVMKRHSSHFRFSSSLFDRIASSLFSYDTQPSIYTSLNPESHKIATDKLVRRKRVDAYRAIKLIAVADYITADRIAGEVLSGRGRDDDDATQQKGNQWWLRGGCTLGSVLRAFGTVWELRYMHHLVLRLSICVRGLEYVRTNYVYTHARLQYGI